MGADGNDNAQTVTDLHLDCYAILGVLPNAAESVIDEAFETLASGMTRSTLPARRMKRNANCRSWPTHTRSSPTRYGVEDTTSADASMH